MNCRIHGGATEVHPYMASPITPLPAAGSLHACRGVASEHFGIFPFRQPLTTQLLGGAQSWLSEPQPDPDILISHCSLHSVTALLLSGKEKNSSVQSCRTGDTLIAPEACHDCDEPQGSIVDCCAAWLDGLYTHSCTIVCTIKGCSLRLVVLHHNRCLGVLHQLCPMA